MPPANVVHLDLLAVERRHDRWRYVFVNENEAYHRWTNGPGDYDESRRLLADKASFTVRAADAGCSVPETLDTLTARWSTARLHEILDRHPERGEVVVKPRASSRARGVLRVRRTEDGGLSLADLTGRSVDADQPVVRQATSFEVIVQPYVAVHPDLAGLGRTADEAATIRVITERTPDGTSVMTAFAEIPHTRGYALVRVDPNRGEFARAASPVVNRGSREIVEEVVECPVPHWSQIVADVRAAHALVPDLATVAWDFVPGVDAAVLLEGNSNWNVVPVQQMIGPLLTRSGGRRVGVAG